MDIVRLFLANQLDGDADPAGGADIELDAHTAAELLGNPDDQLDLDAADPLADLLAPYRHHPDHEDGDADDEADNDDEVVIDRRCQFTTGERVSLAFAAVLLCTGWSRRVIYDPHTGAVLDMGRRSRVFTRTQRRALIYRDRGCVFPGCDRPAKFCDAHHIEPWEHGGLTDLINGVLLCRRHHTMVHHGWHLARNAATGVVTVTSPDGRTFTRQPTARGRPGRSTFDQPPDRSPHIGASEDPMLTRC